MKKNLKAEVAICRNSHDVVSIQIRDDLSHQIVARVEMTIENFGKALLGLAECEASLVQYPSAKSAERIGMLCETMTAFCERSKSYNKQAQAAIVAEAAKAFEADGWELWDDGNEMRQDGKNHCFLLRRWVEPREGELNETAL